MPLPFIYRGVLGVDLSAAQVDGNFQIASDAYDDLVANPPAVNQIESIAVSASGLEWVVTMTDSSTFEVPVQQLVFRWRGAWAPFTLYSPLDTFSVLGSGLFSVLVGHTSGATFDPDLLVSGDNAYLHLLGAGSNTKLGELADVDVTGAAANDFIVAISSGSPPVISWEVRTPAQVAAILGLALDGLTDVDVTGAAANAMLVAVSVGSPATIEWQDRTPTQVTALLDAFVGDTGSPGVGGTKGMVPAPADGDAAANKFLHAGGAFEIVTSGINQLTGDVTAGPGTGSQAATLANTAVTPGSYTLTALTVDAKGRLTAASNGTGDAISDLPLATLPVAALSLMEIAETNGGSPAVYTSKHIRVSDLVHTLGSTAVAMGATVTTLAGLSLTGLTGLAIRDTSAAFDVTLAATSSPVLSAGRVLTLDMSNVAHTLDLGATANTITFPSAASYTVAGLSVAGTWSATQTSMTLDTTTLTGVTTLPGSGQITAAGELHLGASAASRLGAAGTYTTANADLMRLAGTLASSVTSTQSLIRADATFAPSGASLTQVLALQLAPTLNSTAFTINNIYNVYSDFIFGASFTGVVTTFYSYYAADVTPGGGTISNMNQFAAIGLTNGDGITTGAITNRQFHAAGITAGAAGGTLNNRSVQVTVPSGGASSGTANNRGIYITGNGGVASGSPPGTVNNFALISDSTALSQLMSLRIGTGSALATGATTGFIFLSACAGTPTGVPDNAAAGAAAMIYDTTGKKLWIYDQPTATWKGVVVA